MSLPIFAVISLYLVFSIPLTVTDFREQRLPNRYTVSALMLTATLVALDAYDSGLDNLITSLVCAALTWLIGYLMARVHWIGMGDIKLLTGMHLLLGYLNPLLILLSLTLASLLATAVALAMLLIRRISLSSRTAFGPYLLAGFFGAVFVNFTGVA